MTHVPHHYLSVVVPVHNEAEGITAFHDSLVGIIQHVGAYEILYCNDGSSDTTMQSLNAIAQANEHVRVLTLTRNFGKEIAISAGIEHARGDAILMLDADGQHPVELIPEFIKSWKAGYKVVTGLRTANQKEGLVKRYGSRLFYSIFRRSTSFDLVAGATDFRLIDQEVRKEFLRLSERSRIVRGLIDWLGYEQHYIPFVANPRLLGKSPYSYRKLSKLAVDSVVSLSSVPLYLTAFMGVIVLPLSVLLGLFMTIEMLIGDPLQLHITGGAFVLVLVLFLVGCVLMSQGIIGLYLAHIHSETQNRPLYVIDNAASVRLNET
ncbi:MAG: uncharacterized protein JWM81_1077 [Candidatus Saccharibacteria bacterium]|nr:uncharacterized protein [Candidatus Saccharibacteria bacterium]